MLTLLTKIFSKVSELGPDGFVKQLIYRVNPTFFTKELSAPETAAGTDIKQSFFKSSSFADDAYRSYLEGQATRSYVRSSLFSWRRKFIPTRSKLFSITRKLISNDPRLSTPSNVLSIGPRDVREIKHIERNFKNAQVTGVDLFSNNDRIILGDMHDLPFDAGNFDAVFAVHVMEHAFDPILAFSEIERVLRSKGVFCLEVPTNFATTEFDRHDYQSAKQISKLLGAKMQLIFEELGSTDLSKPNSLRLVYQKQ